MLRHKVGLLILCVGISACSEPKERAEINKNISSISIIDSGYQGSAASWGKYFNCIAQIPAFTRLFEGELSGSGVDPAAIALAEQKSGVHFQSSYRDFLLAGGVAYLNRAYKRAYPYFHEDAFWPVSDVSRLSVAIPVDYRAYLGVCNDSNVPSDYYHYRSYQAGDYERDPVCIKDSTLDFLVVGGMFDESYGFSDQERTRDGQMESLLFSASIPGAFRYRSFAEFIIFDILQGLHTSLQNDKKYDFLNDQCTGLLLNVRAFK